MGRSKRMIYFDDTIWSELEKVKINAGIPISRMLEKGAKRLLEDDG